MVLTGNGERERVTECLRLKTRAGIRCRHKNKTKIRGRVGWGRRRTSVARAAAKSRARKWRGVCAGAAAPAAASFDAIGAAWGRRKSVRSRAASIIFLSLTSQDQECRSLNPKTLLNTKP